VHSDGVSTLSFQVKPFFQGLVSRWPFKFCLGGQAAADTCSAPGPPRTHGRRVLVDDQDLAARARLRSVVRIGRSSAFAPVNANAMARPPRVQAGVDREQPDQAGRGAQASVSRGCRAMHTLRRPPLPFAPFAQVTVRDTDISTGGAAGADQNRTGRLVLVALPEQFATRLTAASLRQPVTVTLR
jgi:hypothetical protein